MKRIGLIVDGQSELLSLKKRYESTFRILKTDGPRGHCAKIEYIVSRSRKQIGILKALNCSKVILILDYECRASSYDNFSSSLKKLVKKADFGIEVEVVVVNTMFENWYLADVEILSLKKNYIKDKCVQKNYEGRHGKNELKKLYKSNYAYSETQHGPELFNIIRESVAKKNSLSFKELLSHIK